MDDHKDSNRNERNDRNDYRGDNRPNHNMNRNRGGNRFRHGGGGGHPPGRGRLQRPLLTSSINGAGLSLVALVVSGKNPDLAAVTPCLAMAVVSFGLSALVSYVAQRIRPRIIEWISDAFFLAGSVNLIYIAAKLGGFL